MEQDFSTLSFQRVAEPKEGAFTLLVPHGWIVEGGILRINPMMMGGPAQSVEAKCDLTVKKDTEGTVMIRWIPELTYFDSRTMGFGLGGMFPPGSNYNGMPVLPLMPAVNFLWEASFPNLHPYATDIKIIESRQLPAIAQRYQQGAMTMGLMLGYDAGVVEYKYDEHGITYKEIAFTVIEDMSPIGATGMWKNKDTIIMRAPLRQFAKWQKVLSVIHRSGILNPQWVAMEVRGQIQRGNMVVNSMHEMQKIEREITEHRQKTNWEINNDMFLTLMGQEEYKNPYTGDIERDTDQWKYRWVSPGGDILYTDRPDYDPNIDPDLMVSGFKRSKVRERFTP